MSELKKTRDTLSIGTNVKNQNSFDFSKAEELRKGIIIPNSIFRAVWEKDKGYSVGIENVRITPDYETLNEALNPVGYGVEKDEEGNEILTTYGPTDFEMVARIVKAILIIENYKENG